MVVGGTTADVGGGISTVAAAGLSEGLIVRGICESVGAFEVARDSGRLEGFSEI